MLAGQVRTADTITASYLCIWTVCICTVYTIDMCIDMCIDMNNPAGGKILAKIPKLFPYGLKEKGKRSSVLTSGDFFKTAREAHSPKNS